MSARRKTRHAAPGAGSLLIPRPPLMETLLGAVQGILDRLAGSEARAFRFSWERNPADSSIAVGDTLAGIAITTWAEAYSMKYAGEVWIESVGLVEANGYPGLAAEIRHGGNTMVRLAVPPFAYAPIPVKIKLPPGEVSIWIKGGVSGGDVSWNLIGFERFPEILNNLEALSE